MDFVALSYVKEVSMGFEALSCMNGAALEALSSLKGATMVFEVILVIFLEHQGSIAYLSL